MILFSIICPVYNAVSYLSIAVESIICQDYHLWELFLVDDGSTDGSEILCDKYAMLDNRIHVIHKINEGPLIARNYGIRSASGDYVLFMDSDDWYEKNALSVLNSKIQQYSAVDCIIYKAKKIQQNCEEILFHPEQNKTEELLRGSDTILIETFGKYTYAPPWEKCIRGDIVKMTVDDNIYDYRYAEDAFFSFNVFKHCDSLLKIPEVLYNYRINGGGICHNVTLVDLKGRWIYYEKIYRYCISQVRGFSSHECWKNMANTCVYYYLIELMKQQKYCCWSKTAKEIRKTTFLDLTLYQVNSDRTSKIFLLLFYLRLYFLCYCFGVLMLKR